LLLTATTRSVHAQERDPWWGRDKAAHLTVSVGLSSLTYGLVRSQTDRKGLCLAWGAGVGLGAGLAKEALDFAGLGTPSWKDFLWDAIGTALGLGVSVGLDSVLGATVKN
jgi:putative lipoprotein